MTNLFPQQRFFAIIIFISLCLHTALFVSGTVRQTEQSRVYKSERILEQLSSEFSFPLVYKDKVSLSVIANSYAKQYDINRIVIRNVKDKILVQTGNDPMLAGENFETDIKVNKNTIGHIEITLKSVSNIEIFKFLWLFILTSLIIHLGVWFLYLNCSMPSEEDLQKIRDEMYENYLQQQGDHTQPIIRQPRKQAPKKVLMELADYMIAYKQNKSIIADNSPQETAPKVENTSKTITVNKAEQVTTKDENQVQEKVSEDVNRSNKIIGATRTGATKLTSKKHSILFPKGIAKVKQATTGNVNIDKQAKKIVQVKQSILIKKRYDKPSLLNEQPAFTKLALEFQFVDKYKLLDKVMPEIATRYFELCDQFLQMAINHLLTEEQLQGVSLVNKPTFNIEGARVELQTTSNNQKQLLLASTMLAVLYQMINKVIYNARREAEMFAFHMNIGISYINQESLLSKFSEFNTNENVMISLQYSVLKLIKDEVIINKNVQQKYHYVESLKKDLLSTVIRIRNNVLEME